MGDDTVLALHFVSAAGEESGRTGNINTVEAVVLDKLAQMAQVARMCAQIFELQSTIRLSSRIRCETMILAT